MGADFNFFIMYLNIDRFFDNFRIPPAMRILAARWNVC
jgi:hypothetical protein